MQSVPKNIKKFSILRKVEIIATEATYYTAAPVSAPKKLPLTSKEAYIAYMSTPCTLVCTVRVISSYCAFSKLPRQHPQAGKTSGTPTAANVNVVCMADAIAPSTLMEIVAKTFHGQSVIGVVLTPQLIGGVQISGAGGGIRLIGDISGGLHELDDVVAVRHR